MRTNREPADASKLSPAQPGITHQQPSNAICYSPACIERWIRQGGSAVLVVDKQGRQASSASRAVEASSALIAFLSVLVSLG
jgi:hypothetical protein